MDFHRVTWSERFRRRLRDWDAALEHGLFQLGRRLGEALWRIRHASDRLEPSPFGRVMVTVACEALTYATIGAVLLTALAQPAFRAVNEENWLKQTDLAVTFLDSGGQVLGKRGILHLESVAVEQLPEHLVKAALGTEDRRFYEHFGIDIGGLFRAMMSNARAGGVVQGGSTITQQLAKNLFLNNERTLDRKIKEAFLSFWLEARLPKNEILRLYLDRAYLGNGVFGVQSAAEHYFGKNVRDITLAEAAMIAGLFKAPSRFSPTVNLPAARARAADVLSNMVEAKFLTPGQVAAALRNPATPIERNTDTVADYALDFAFEQIRQLAAAGKLGNERVLTVRTPIDRNLQRHAERSLEAILREQGPKYGVSQAAMVVLDHDGGLRAMIGGRDYGQSQFNRATQAMRQTGSSFKTFVYAAALAEGVVKPDTIVTDRPTCVGNWCPANYGRSYAGSMSATVAFAKSINTIPVQLTTSIGKGNNKLGREKIIAFTKAVGFQNDLRDMTSLPIGSSEATVIDMVAGFNTFANGGKLAKPYAAREVLNAQGQVIYRPDPPEIRHDQVMPPQAAKDLVYMMSKVPTEGTGRRAFLPGVPTGGKTGTTDEYRNAWYGGFSGTFTSVVWFGNDDFSPTNNMTGGSLPAMAFARVMAFAHLDTELKPLFGLEHEMPQRDPKLLEVAGTADLARGEGALKLRLTPAGRNLLKEIEALAEDPSEKPDRPLSQAPALPGRS
ncbi:MAG: PBP1A family penicillin-binding protein [Methylobacterium sp.]|nr:PBP1A family penicillin-binding protein [Methylobacterium sp.]